MADCDFITTPHPYVYQRAFARSPALHTCPVCGDQFTEEGKRGPKAETLYCSRICYSIGKAKNLGNLLRVEAGTPVYRCLHCESEFTGRKRKYCSDGCAEQAKRKRENKTGRTRKAPNPIIDGMRECVCCGKSLPLSEYPVIKTRCKSGESVSGRCVDCLAEYNRTRRKPRTKEQRKAERARARRRTKDQRQAERARIAARKGREYKPGGHDTRKLSMHVLQSRLAKKNAKQAWEWWMEQAPDEWMTAYWEAAGRPWSNPRLSQAERYRLRYSLNLEFNLKERIRRQHAKKAKRDGVQELIRGAIRRNGRSRRVEELCGYSIAELKGHLERQFKRGMNWERFLAGDIHIDHIIPQSHFDLSDDEEWRRCWCLSNLQPLWARDNLEKRDHVLFLL